MKNNFITKCSVIALTIGLASTSLNVNLLPNAYASSIQSQQSAQTDTLSKIKKIIVDHLGIDESKVTPESSFIDDLGTDSLDTVELVMAFEEVFEVEISDSDAEKMLTVGDVSKYVDKKRDIKHGQV
jgi:acyl carrier protein